MHKAVERNAVGVILRIENASGGLGCRRTNGGSALSRKHAKVRGSSGLIAHTSTLLWWCSGNVSSHEARVRKKTDRVPDSAIVVLWKFSILISRLMEVLDSHLLPRFRPEGPTSC